MKLVEQCDRALRRVSVQFGSDRKRNQILRMQSQIEVLQIIETSCEESCADKQHRGQDNLRNYQPLAEANLPQRTGNTRALLAKRTFQIQPCGRFASAR